MAFSALVPRCPHCESARVVKQGIRKNALRSVQRYKCRSCGRVFTPGPRALRNKTYPQKEIIEAITLYDRGHSLAETARRISSRHGHRVAPSTISRWLAQHPTLTSYRRLRNDCRTRFTPAQIIYAHKLYHRQVYDFAYHRGKLDLLRRGMIGKRSKPSVRFSPLADFLEAVPRICPHDLFTDESGSRGSQIADGFLDSSRLTVREKQNTATDTAALVIPTVGNNRDRHPALQRFMLANDSVTLAVEVPVWLSPEDVRAVEARHHIRLSEPGKSARVTGHLDFIQVRNDSVHILDYKPDAHTNRPVAQLTVYALAIEHLTGIPLFDITCAWFNEDEYCEFYPRTVLARADSASMAA